MGSSPGGILAAALVGGSDVAKAVMKSGPGAVKSAGKFVRKPVTGPYKVLADLVGDTAKGALAGTATMLPLSVVAETSEERGSLLAGGLIYGAGGGAFESAKGSVKSSVSNFGRSFFRPDAAPVPESARVPVTAYGVDNKMDAAHKKYADSMPADIVNRVEALRDLVGDNSEVYVVSPDDYVSMGLGNSSGYAFKRADGRNVAVIRGGSEALFHEVGHVIESALSPEERKKLVNAVFDGYSVNELNQMRDYYESRGIKLDSDDALISEIIAENFQVALNGGPLGKLGTPQSLAANVYSAIGRMAERRGFRNLVPGSDVVTSETLRFQPSFIVQEALRSAMEARNFDFSGTPPAPVPAAATPAPAPAAATPAPAPAAATPAPALTPEAEDMLNKLSEGGAAPSFVSKNLERIAAENGVEVTDKTTPNQIVDELKKKKSIYTTDRKRKQIGQPPSSVTQEVGQEEQEAPPEIQKQNEDLFKAEVAKPRAERGAFELPYSSAEETEASPTSREGLTQPQRAEQRALADMGGKVGASGPLRRLYNKVTVPYLYKVAKKSGKPTITGFSVDKVLRNIDMLAGWMERNPVAAQRIRDRTGVQSFGSPEFVAQFQAFLANQANGYRGDGKPLTLLPENDPEGMPPPTPGYTPVPVPEGAARLINSLMGVRNAFDPKADASVREAFVQRLAEANGVQVVEVNEVGEKGRTATEYNPVNKLLRDEGFDTNLFHVAIEQLRVRRMFATAKPRPDLSGLRAPVQGTIQIGYMPAPAPETNKPGTGLEFENFFTSVTKGTFGKSDKPFKPEMTMPTALFPVIETKERHSGNFDDHIAKSIPTFYEAQIAVVDSLSKMPAGSKVLDIAASEGSFGKAVTELSQGGVETVSLDPNLAMAEFFRTKSEVPGATYSTDAFLNGFDAGNRQVNAFQTDERFDAIHESMGFQFIDPDRASQVDEVKRLLKPDGIFVTEEKVRNPNWAANETLKDQQHKNKYFTPTELAEKDKQVGFAQSTNEKKSVGMVSNMVSQETLENVLRERFDYVVQYWDAGNFKGYVASDSRVALDRFLNDLNLPQSKFSTEATPRDISPPKTMDEAGDQTFSAPAGEVRFMPAPALDTPEFKNFFKDSKVVDAEGNPLPLYRGDRRDVGPAFRAGREGGALGNGIYLTPDPEFASGYADDFGKSPGSGVVSKVYASLQNPLVIEAAKRGQDPVVLGFVQLGMDRKKAESFVEKQYEQKGYIYNQLRNKAVSAGHDGIMLFTDGELAEVVAFEPRQVKSATGNTGAFGQRPLTDAELSKFNLTAAEARTAQWKGDIRFMPLGDEKLLPKNVQFKRSRMEGSVGGVIPLVHFSSVEYPRGRLDPKKTSGRGAATPVDLRGLPRGYFDTVGTDYESRISSRPVIYSAVVDGNAVYDLDSDPLGYRNIVNREKADQMLVDEGFVGMKGTAGSTEMVALFEPVKVDEATPEEVFKRRELAERRRRESLAGGAFMPAPALDTPEFKKWFGDWEDPRALMTGAKGPVSHVVKSVDGKLQPRVVYHGTGANFTEFRKSGIGTQSFGFLGSFDVERTGIFFAEDPDVASSFADKSGGNVIPAYLDIKAPANLLTPDSTYDVLEEIGWNGRAAFQSGFQAWELFDDEKGKQFVEALKKAGYDGAMMSEYVPSVDKSTDVWVAFEPTQVKSATGNTGAFSPENPDIRFMPAPAPNTPEFKKWFGASKIVDENGKPKVMYHGTAEDFSTFKPSRRGAGIFFSEDPVFASSFAEFGLDEKLGLLEATGKQPTSGAAVYPVYVKAEKPWDYRNETDRRLLETALRRLEWVTQDAIARGDWDVLEHPDSLRAIKNAGYDGYFLFEEGRRNLAVFKPERVKSATGNTGAFGQRPLTDAELSKFSLTAEEAQQAQERGDIRFMAAEPTGTPGVTETKPVVAIPSDPKAFQKVVKAIQKEPKTMASIAARVKDSERYKEMVAEVSDLPPLDPARMQAEEDALADGTEAEINRRARARYKAQGGAFTSVTFSLLDATKTKASLAKNVIDANPTRLFDKLDSAKDMLARDPERIASPAGFGEYMKAAGMSGDILSAPPMLGTMLQRPEDYVALLQGGYHGDRTKPGTMEAADAGLDSTVRMREAINGRPPELVTALHSLWGILSRMLAPIHQEAMWLRLVSTPYIMDQIQASVDGNFNLTKDEWKTMVRRAKLESDSFSDKLGNPGVSNANAFYLMLTALNGKWDLMSDVYAAPNSTEMGRRFWSLGVGKLGIRNKVQRFIGLTFGIPALIMDRWKFVEFYFQQFGKPPQDYFIYDSGNTPEDPNGIYGFYGPYEGKNNPLSLAMYEGFELAVNAAIANSSQLRTVLGRHANLGGMHWKGWNAIKNEAVGHSSLDLTYDLVQKNPNPTAQDVLDLIKTKDYYTEGLVGTEIKRFTLPRNR